MYDPTEYDEMTCDCCKTTIDKNETYCPICNWDFNHLTLHENRIKNSRCPKCLDHFEECLSEDNTHCTNCGEKFNPEEL